MANIWQTKIFGLQSIYKYDNRFYGYMHIFVPDDRDEEASINKSFHAPRFFLEHEVKIKDQTVRLI